MNARLNHLFDQIENQKKELLSSLHQLSPEKLNQHPEEKWSVNQIIAHLSAAEKLSLIYLGKKINAIREVDDTGFREELKMLMLMGSQRLPFKFKAPQKVKEHTTQSTDLPTLVAEWDDVRAHLKSILENISDEHINRKVYKHVRVGMISVRHMLIFFREHVIHHTQQIKKLVNE